MSKGVCYLSVAGEPVTCQGSKGQARALGELDTPALPFKMPPLLSMSLQGPKQHQNLQSTPNQVYGTKA